MTTRPSSALSPRAIGALVLLFGLLIAAMLFVQGRGAAEPGSATVPSGAAASSGQRTSAGAASGSAELREPPAEAPLVDKATYVLATIQATGRQPSGYVGGRKFMNDGRGGTALLPRKDADGNPITYREYDVNPAVKGVNRGPQRLVVGSDGSAYMTADHYETWDPVP